MNLSEKIRVEESAKAFELREQAAKEILNSLGGNSAAAVASGIENEKSGVTRSLRCVVSKDVREVGIELQLSYAKSILPSLSFMVRRNSVEIRQSSDQVFGPDVVRIPDILAPLYAEGMDKACKWISVLQTDALPIEGKLVVLSEALERNKQEAAEKIRQLVLEQARAVVAGVTDSQIAITWDNGTLVLGVENGDSPFVCLVAGIDREGQGGRIQVVNFPAAPVTSEMCKRLILLQSLAVNIAERYTWE